MAIRLRRLAVVGFKSFADPVELLFDPGITAIVGPNGSGKSNLTEAIAWVLGEQSGAAMRSRRSEEVIFAGGPGRPSLGMAEVTLVLEQDGEELGLPYGEVSVTRRVFRDGENQYLVNGARARLRDVLRIAAAVRAEWIIVRQGAVDRLLDQRPTERRDYLEYASGLATLRLRQAEARQQLTEAEQHAQRLEDVLRELEPHLQSLAAAAERAREALAVRQAMRATTVQLFAARWQRVSLQRRDVQQRLESLEARYRALQLEQEERASRVTRYRAAYDALRAEREEIGQRCDERRRHLTAVQHEAQLARTRAAALAEQLSALAGDRERAEEELVGAREEYQRLAEAEREAHTLRAELEAALERQAALLAERQRRAEALRNELATVERERQRLVAERESNARERAALEAAVETRRQEQARLEARQKELAEQRGLRERELTDLAGRLAALDGQLADAWSEAQRWAETVSRHQAELARRSQAVQELERELLVTRTKLSALAQALESDLVASAPRAVLAAAKRGQLSGVVGTLGSLLDVPAEIEQAIEAALGAHLHDIVVERWEDAEVAIAFLKAQRAGRATFHPLDTVRSAPPARLTLVRSEPGVLGVAAELVTAPPPIRPIVQALLGRVLVVADLATTRRILPQLPSGWVVVTRDGELARPTGSVTGGASRSRERGLLASVREQRELAARCERLEQLLAQARRDLETAQASYEEARTRQDATEGMVRTLDRERRELRATLARLEHESSLLSQQLEQEARALDELRALLDRDAERLRCLAEREAASLAALDALASRQQELDAERQAVETPDPERERLASQLATARERAEALARERARLERQIARLEATLLDYASRAATLQDEYDRAVAAAERAEALAQELVSELVDLDRRAAVLDEELARRAEECAAAQAARSETERELRSLEQSLTEARLLLERVLEAERALLDNAVWELGWSDERERLVEELESVARTVDDPPERLERRLVELRRRSQELSRFGEAAIAQYESERARYEQLRAELDDVRSTIRTLRTLLADLDRQIERGFARSLRELDRAFATTFAELFGGGRARLVARDGTGSIEGVDLVVQPAGKRVRSIQQLSGGERALAALALRFALLELDPLPFCVLDEVDAALDEANVLRFRSVLERLSARTQFIVVTHNRATIEAAGILYGVTMGDDGASKVVSLRLADYVGSER